MRSFLEKYTGYLILTGIILLVLVIPMVIQFVNNQQKAVISLKIPDSYEIGELVILDASASKADELIWRIIPMTPNFKVTGKTAVFTSTEPIDYMFVLAARNNKDLDCQVYTLSYGKKEKIIDSKLTDFEQIIKDWLGNLNTPNNRGPALRLAQSFKIIASTIENGTYESIDGLILATAWANTEALGLDLEAWKPFLQKFSNYLENDPPITVKDHADIWRNMADALEKLFGAPC